YRIFTKGQNRSQIRQNREQNWKEREKPRPKLKTAVCLSDAIGKEAKAQKHKTKDVSIAQVTLIE
ncbi:hypothetical protein Tco_0984881, partial [Tanacetum coccineum]